MNHQVAEDQLYVTDQGGVLKSICEALKNIPSLNSKNPC